MIYLCILLPAYRQLTRLRKEALTKAEEVIADFVRESGCISLLQEEGAWLFQLASAGNSGENNRRKRRFAMEAYALKEKLKEYERQLQGYNLLIDGVEEAKPAIPLEMLKNRILTGGCDGELWIAGAAIPEFEGIFVTTPIEEYLFKISGIEAGGESSGRPVANFLVRESLYRDFIDTCESIYLGKNDIRNIILITNPGDGGLHTIEYALRNMFSGADASWIATYGTESRFGDAIPFSRGVTESLDLYSIPDHLTELERYVWDRHLPILFPDSADRKWCPVNDRPEVDYFQILALQLASYRRWIDAYLLPAVWLCERFDLLSSSAKGACARAAKSNAQSSDIISVFVVQGQTVPEELLEVPHVLLRVPTLGRQEIISKVTGSLLPEVNCVTDERARNFVEQLVESGTRSINSLYRVLSVWKNSGISSGVIEDPLTAMLAAFDSDLQKALLYLIEGSLVLPEDPLAHYLGQAGLNGETIRAARFALQEIRLDIAADRDEAMLAMAHLRRKLGVDGKEALANLASYIAEHMTDGGLHLSFAAVNTVWIGGNPKVGADLITGYVQRMHESGNIRGALDILNNADTSGVDTDTALILSRLKLKTAILGSESRQAAGCYAELRSLDGSESQEIEGQRYLEHARYHFATGSYQEGLQDAKNALMAFQKHESEQETEAYLYIGLHMLASSRINEAEAYLQIARESASGISPMLFIVNGIYAAVTQFMIGNMTRALAAIGEARTRADECSLHRFEPCLLILEVRIKFELGRYSECIELCLTGLTLCQLYGGEPRGVFDKWLRRAQAFSGFPDEAVVALSKITADPEAVFFLSEAYYLADRREKALACIKEVELSEGTRSERFSPAEEIFWDSGFSNMEDRAITGPGDRPVLTMLIRAFRAYLLCGVDASELGLNDLARITREEKLSNIDPYNGIYLYFYAHAIGTMTNKNELDRLTALSKAFKSVQERASMMDNSTDKQSFLHNNYFNRLILSEAHESNLI